MERIENTLEREKLLKAMNGCIEWIRDFFEKNGTYNSETTSKMRIYAKKGKRASYLLRLLGQYKKREVKEGGCFTIGSPQDDGSRLVYYTYPHIQVVTSTNTAGKTETIHLVDGLFR